MALDATELTRRLAEELSYMENSYWIHLQAPSPIEKYPAKQHARSVACYLGVHEGLIYLAGQQTAFLEDSDQPRPFRQRRYFYYITGVDFPDCFVTYNIGQDVLTLYIPPVNPRTIIWNGRGHSIDECEERYDVDAVRLSTSVDYDIQSYINNNEGNKIYVLHPNQKPHLRNSHTLYNTQPKKNIFDIGRLRKAMDNARVRKCPHEIRLIRHANAVTASAHRSVLLALRTLDNEAQVQAIFLDTCIAKNARYQAYEVIAASGKNASILHYVGNDQSLRGKQLVCLDAGCEWDCYASDVTRTFPISGRWSREAKEIYDLVQEMQSACIGRVRPGVRFLDLHILAHQIAIKGLLRLGILHGGTEREIYRAGTSMAFFPHGLGHHLGLEVHDPSGDEPLMSAEDGEPWHDLQLKEVKGVSQSRKGLEEGMVVTIEPGIYFSEYSLSHEFGPSSPHSRYINPIVLQRYLAVGGVRIEDDILVTANGYENLTTAPKGEEMLRIILGEDIGDKGEDTLVLSRGGTGGRIDRITTEKNTRL
ncbi:MAG: hypothetical protein M1840_006230 [Geoglossum simile]|nr:MAG: hypothetical protein M1840_006230 [Geoglossum simile]